MTKVLNFLKLHWRDIVIAAMFLWLLSEVQDARDVAFGAYDAAASAGDYARAAASNSEDAYNAASEASEYASDASDNAWYCRY